MSRLGSASISVAGLLFAYVLSSAVCVTSAARAGQQTDAVATASPSASPMPSYRPIASDHFFDARASGGGPNATMIDKLVVAPGSVFFVGINPLRYPDWTMSINDVISAAPKPSVATAFSGAPLSAPDVTFTPVPTPTPTSIQTLPNPMPTAIASVAPTHSCELASKPTNNEAAACLTETRELLRNTISLVQCIYDEFEKARAKYHDLWAEADKLVSDAGTLQSHDAYVAYLTQASNGPYEITRRSFLKHVYNLQLWPVEQLAEIESNLEALQTFYNARNRSDRNQIDEAEKEIKTAASAIQEDKTLLKNLQQAGAAAKKLVSDRIDSNEAKSKGLNASIGSAKSELPTIMTGLAAQAELEAQAADYRSDSARAKQYASALSDTISIVQKRVLRASPDRFGYFDQLSCKGLEGSGREKDYVLSLGDGGSGKVRLLCAPRMFLSYGIAFSGLAQAAYSTTALAPKQPFAVVAPTPVPNVQIVAQTQSKINATPMVLNNIRLFNSDAEDGVYGSFGASLSNGGTGTSVEYLGGISYSLSRVVLVTAGVQYGPEQVLPNGYTEGTILPPGSAAPATLTHTIPKFFLGITFGSSGN